MSVSAIGPVGNGTAPVYAALSPFLNGVRRTSNAAAAAQIEAAAAAKSAAATAAAIAARAEAAATVTAAPPFLNPAITQIADATALGQAVIPAVATTPNAQPTVTTVNPNTFAPPASSATDSVLHGDSGELVQSYGAVALVAGPLAVAQFYGVPHPPAVPAVVPVSAYPRITRVADA